MTTNKMLNRLDDLKSDIESDRAALIRDMRSLAECLAREAVALENESDREPNSLGYVAVTSLSQDIDRRAQTLNVKMNLHRRFMRALLELGMDPTLAR